MNPDHEYDIFDMIEEAAYAKLVPLIDDGALGLSMAATYRLAQEIAQNVGTMMDEMDEMESAREGAETR